MDQNDNSPKLEGQYKNQMMYVFALAIIRSVNRDGMVDREVLNRINKKCAEITGCMGIPI